MNIGRQLKIARADADLSQRQVEEKIGIKQNVISRIEIGKVIPNCKTVEDLANCYGYNLRLIKKADNV